MLNGIINVYKEAGYTSHDVVAKMRGICRQKKIGHTGTLDPAATGVLPVCLGTGTRLCDMLTHRDKEYVTELLLGVVTDTQDTTGQVLERREVTVSEEQVRSAALSFLGAYDQIPPMYSALKVNGKKLYELARAGQEVERTARSVEILELEILELSLPVVKMRVVCTKGTYIRTLCADIGERLGCGGTMQSLERTRVGGFRKEDAYTLAQLERIRDGKGLESVLFSVESAFEDTGRVCVRPEFDRLLRNGNPIRKDWIGAEESGGKKASKPGSRQSILAQGHARDGVLVRMCTSDGTFLGVYEFCPEKQNYRPFKMFLEN